MSVLLVLEESNGKIKRASWEALAAALRLAPGESITAVVIGARTEQLAAEAAERAVGKVVRVEHPLLAHYTPDGFCAALQQLVLNESPTQVVFPHTYQVRDYAPALACRMGQVLIGDVVGIENGPVFTRQLMQGRLNGSYRHNGKGPCFRFRCRRERFERTVVIRGPEGPWRRCNSSAQISIPRKSVHVPTSPFAAPRRQSISARRSAL